LRVQLEAAAKREAEMADMAVLIRGMAGLWAAHRGEGEVEGKASEGTLADCVSRVGALVGGSVEENVAALQALRAEHGYGEAGAEPKAAEPAAEEPLPDDEDDFADVGEAEEEAAAAPKGKPKGKRGGGR
jgi:hypothetical protein